MSYSLVNKEYGSVRIRKAERWKYQVPPGHWYM